MIEKDFKFVIQYKKNKLSEELFYTDSRDIKLNLQGQIDILDTFVKDLFIEMQYNLLSNEETIVRLQREIDRLTYHD